MELRLDQLEQLTPSVHHIAQPSILRNQPPTQALASVQVTGPNNIIVTFTNATNPDLQRLNQRTIP